MLLKHGGWYRRAKISKTKLPLPHIFCPLNNTFQNIPFQHLHWAKHNQQCALSGATQGQLSLTLCAVFGTETGCSPSLLHLSWQERIMSLSRLLPPQWLHHLLARIFYHWILLATRKMGKDQKRDSRNEEDPQPPAFLLHPWCYFWLFASATSG